MKKFATIFRILNSINDSMYIGVTEENLKICFENFVWNILTMI